MRGQSLLNFWKGCSFDSLQDVGDVLVLLGLGKRALILERGKGNERRKEEKTESHV